MGVQESNRGGRGRPRRGAAIVSVCLLGLAAVACGGTTSSSGGTDTTLQAASVDALLGSEQPASGDPVKIGLVSEGSTPAFDNTDELRAGQATVDFLNARRGGIGGRPVQLVTCEIQGDPSRAAECANQMIQEGVVAVTMTSSTVAENLWQPLHDAGVPTFFQAGFGDAMETDADSTFLLANPSATFFGLPIATAQAVGAKKVAFVVIDVPQAVDLIESDGDRIMGSVGLDYEVVRVPVGTADMTSQMQQVVDSGAGVVHVIGNDAFCIAAFNGLRAVAYTGAITAIAQCITDATREALPGGLEGINVLATMAAGATDDPGYQLFQAVMATYGQDVKDPNGLYALGGYSVIASLATALQGIDGEITTASVIDTIKHMPESEIAGSGGATFKCGGSADPALPAVCTNQWLRTQLDANGNPTTYTVEDSSSLAG